MDLNLHDAFFNNLIYGNTVSEFYLGSFILNFKNQEKFLRHFDIYSYPQTIILNQTGIILLTKF